MNFRFYMLKKFSLNRLRFALKNDACRQTFDVGNSVGQACWRAASGISRKGRVGSSGSQSTRIPCRTARQDLKLYRRRIRKKICGQYRSHKVCTIPSQMFHIYINTSLKAAALCDSVRHPLEPTTMRASGIFSCTHWERLNGHQGFLVRKKVRPRVRPRPGILKSSTSTSTGRF